MNDEEDLKIKKLQECVEEGNNHEYKSNSDLSSIPLGGKTSIERINFKKNKTEKSLNKIEV